MEYPLLDEVVRRVAKAFKIDEEVIRAKGGMANTARRVALYLAHRYTGLSNNAIGDLLGGIHYSAVSKASGRLREEMISDQGLSKLVDELDSHFKTFVPRDELNRLKRVEYEDGSAIEYTHDNAGNRATSVSIRITVVSPNGGESWKRNSTHAITWVYKGNPGSYVKIELLKGGVLNLVITSSTSVGSGGSGSFNWRIPANQTQGSDYKIRVTSISNGFYKDTSNNNFSIT